MRRLAVISFHTSPLQQPGVGDSGGLNVYVRELVSSLAQAGVACDVYTRTWEADLASEVIVEPGFRVVHIDAGPRAELDKEDLLSLVPSFTAGVIDHIRATGEADAVHAHYWLSGIVGHTVKHELGMPLLSTFHTLARVKAQLSGPESEAREQAESMVIGCSDAILANSIEEAGELQRHYGAAVDRIEVVPPGVDHAFFSPGDRDGARVALGWRAHGVHEGTDRSRRHAAVRTAPGLIDLTRMSDAGGLGAPQHPVLLFVGRIQPLKGVDVAVRTLAELGRPDAELVILGGPSGPDGLAELARVHELVSALGIESQVRFVEPQPHHLLSTWYRAADVVLVPSRTESFGLVALEASACGTPLVVASVGGLQTLVDHGVNGFLVESRSPIDYARHVATLLDDRDRAQAMGAGGALRARDYTWSMAAGRIRRIHADLTERVLVECR